MTQTRAGAHHAYFVWTVNVGSTYFSSTMQATYNLNEIA